MNKISHLIVIILAIALAFAACGGNVKSKLGSKTNASTGENVDDSVLRFGEDGEDGEDGKDGDGEGEPEKTADRPVFWPSMIYDVTVDCGKDLNMEPIETKGGTGEISWQVSGLPSWAKAVPSESSKNILRVSGHLPFEGCDVNTHKVSLKVCGSKGSACSENSFNIKTKIHGIRIETALSDTSAVIDVPPTIPELKAAGGSGNYSFTTTIPKGLIDKTQDKIIYGGKIEFTPKKIGSYTITIKAKDLVFDGREEGIAQKTGDSADQIGTATKEFKVNVKEDGFIINVSLTDAGGTPTATAQSGSKQLDDKSFEVPYDGKMKIDINGKGEKYFLTIKSKELSVIDKKNIEVIRGTPHEILFSDPTILAKVKELEENPIKITITAKNEAGDGETLAMERITFAKDPCADESMSVVLSPDDHPEDSISIERGSDSEPVVSLSVKGGKGPFYWKIPTEMKESLGEVETGVTVAPLVPTDITETTEPVDLNGFYWVDYDQGSRTANRETIKITRDTAYRDINASLGWKAKRELSDFDQGTSGDRIKVYEVLKVKVVDKECKKTITRNIPIVVEIPKPSQEEIKNVRFAHRVRITDTYNGSMYRSKAKMTLYDDTGNEKLGMTDEKDIAARCGETRWFYRWNWPSFDKPITNTNKQLTNIGHLELKMHQPKHSWDLNYELQKFYIVGKNWVYFDNNEEKTYKFEVADGKTHIVCIAIGDNKCPESPKSDTLKDSFDHNTGGATSNGKWYLKEDPNSDNSTWKDNEDANIKFEADDNPVACDEPS